jgi:chromosome segregation ATPase
MTNSAYVLDLEQQVSDLTGDCYQKQNRIHDLEAENENLQREFDETVQVRDQLLRDLAALREQRNKPTIEAVAAQAAQAEHAVLEAYLKVALAGRDPADFRLYQRTDWSSNTRETWLEPK